ncbi:MAG: hypothetical protein H7Z13_13800 [Ferruginibacter sp.]|nr:hypothetical protein [Ferruginibacter sp.]
MNWKAFIAFSVSGFLVSFPQNIIGCGDGMDPYDYYTSFFHPDLPETDGYRPFYYTGYNFLYEDKEPADVSELLAKEWAYYCGAHVNSADAKIFVNKFAPKDINSLYTSIEKNQSAPVADSVMRNSMTTWFIENKDLEALGYLLYAKQVEPNVLGSSDSWEPVKRDSVKMAKLIKNGQQLYRAAKKDFFKLRYAYQVVRLAHYSGRYADAIQMYDSYISANTTNSVLQPLSLALKGGALYRTGKLKEAAYLFSRAFSSSVAKRVSNYLGFSWSVNSAEARKDYLAYCKNNGEKAGMLSLFSMGSTGNELGAMKEIYQLNAGCPELEVLAVREINKLEEKYFTPSLQKEKGGVSFYYYWERDGADSLFTAAGKETSALMAFLHEVAKNKIVKNPGLFETGAAYTAYMMKDYSSAKKYLAAAQKMNLTPKIKNQWTLTNILVTINENEQMGAAFEEQLLPSLQWLEERVKTEKPTGLGFNETGHWRKIYRDLMSEILSRRYHKLGEYHKEALCIGAADIIGATGSNWHYNRGIDFMRNNLAVKDVEKLYSFITGKQKNKFENFLLQRNSINQSVVTDFAGTAYLRAFDYANAIQWFKKSTDKKTMIIHKNPFIDLLYDQEEQLPSEANFSTNKIAFAETMLRLMQQAATDKVNSAKYYYKIANGMYNTTYYGHAWELVQYERSGSDGYRIPNGANAFQKEYYGCFSAQEYFEKAMTASVDKNFKARCLFMMAKCSQKQVARPSYSDFNSNYDQLAPAEKLYWAKFKQNRHFPQLIKDYNNTVFYKEVYNSCSFLQDFIRKR